MRVALVTGHFTPELGYQEMYLARSFARLGHQVRVFTTTAVSPTARRVVRQPYQPGLYRENAGFDVLRLDPTLSYSANVVARGLRDAVHAFGPDIVVIIGLAKLFPGSLLCTETAGRAAIVTVFGDAPDYVDTSSVTRRVRFALQRLLFRAVKRRLYRRAVRFSRRIVLNHAETRSILLGQLRHRDREFFHAKLLELTLGFDPGEFFYTATDRDERRAALGLAPEEVALITCTRVNRRKNLERVIALVSALASRGLPLRYLIVGFLGDEYEAELKAFIARQPRPERFLCFPFLGHDEIRKMYCASDAGIWLKAAISIQEAMGTGLPVVLEDREIVGHLVEPGVNGWYFAPERLEQVLCEAMEALSRQSVAERARRRELLVGANAARLSYDSIAQRMIDGLAR